MGWLPWGDGCVGPEGIGVPWGGGGVLWVCDAHHWGDILGMRGRGGKGARLYGGGVFFMVGVLEGGGLGAPLVLLGSLGCAL